MRSGDMKSKVADNEKIGEIIESIQVGMLTTVQLNGELRKSTDALCGLRFFDCLWFLAKESKPLIAEAIGERGLCQPGKETVHLSDRARPTSRG
jgi:hypothetical protein